MKLDDSLGTIIEFSIEILGRKQLLLLSSMYTSSSSSGTESTGIRDGANQACGMIIVGGDRTITVTSRWGTTSCTRLRLTAASSSISSMWHS